MPNKEQYETMTTAAHKIYMDVFTSKQFTWDGLHLLNASIVPLGLDGQWTLIEVPPVVAFRLHVAAIETGPRSGEGTTAGVFSHIGHEGTAQAITELHGTEVKVDRSPWDGKGIGLAMTLKARQREGEILTKERLQEVGYVWRLIYHGELQSANLPT
jgi:hypothetical protein